MNKFFLMILLFLVSAQSQGQTYTLYFFENHSTISNLSKDTFFYKFSSDVIQKENSARYKFNKIIFDLKRKKQYVISDTKKIILFSDTLKEYNDHIRLNANSTTTLIDTLYFGYKSKLYIDTLVKEYDLGSSDTIIQKIIYADKWPFNPMNYFEISGMFGLSSFTKGYPVYSYFKSTGSNSSAIEEYETGIFKIEKSKRRNRQINLPKNYSYKKWSYEVINEILKN